MVEIYSGQEIEEKVKNLKDDQFSGIVTLTKGRISFRGNFNGYENSGPTTFLLLTNYEINHNTSKKVEKSEGYTPGGSDGKFAIEHGVDDQFYLLVH